MSFEICFGKALSDIREAELSFKSACWFFREGLLEDADFCEQKGRQFYASALKHLSEADRIGNANQVRILRIIAQINNSQEACEASLEEVRVSRLVAPAC
jgi:hypothetical protein